MWGNLLSKFKSRRRYAEFESRFLPRYLLSGATPSFSLPSPSRILSLPDLLHLLTMDRTDKMPHSKPISINTAASHHSRYRSDSVSSDSSDGSPSDPIQTPLSANPPKVTTVSPSTSPFFSYIMGQQPGVTKTFPFRRSTVDSIGSTGPVFDDEPSPAPLRKVHRRATTSWTATSPPQSMNPLAGGRQERASGVLRRLSLSTSFTRPQPGFGSNEQTPVVPPNTALPNSPINGNTPLNRGTSPPRKPIRRAPSPMGERILKGHFDGFN
ncbi:hypothetical protein BDM02DRAFT_379076 [Thelephora ganbajun]|uniref:Uncharacterized protein n=1 Tax=Thelephora ganbajun TaxID=370292 RepID=A0ACB6Z8N7_THEGA|nr:hypothetical protein BDM02DRAFT_379076 [Thelephora ganbajun]